MQAAYRPKASFRKNSYCTVRFLALPNQGFTSSAQFPRNPEGNFESKFLGEQVLGSING